MRLVFHFFYKGFGRNSFLQLFKQTLRAFFLLHIGNAFQDPLFLAYPQENLIQITLHDTKWLSLCIYQVSKIAPHKHFVLWFVAENVYPDFI